MNNNVEKFLYKPNTPFGSYHIYIKGDIIVWRGEQPCITRITKQIAGYNYKTTAKSHNSLYYQHIRLATDEEKNILGDKDIFLINEKNLRKLKILKLNLILNE
jgi:hypothetical protein